jgi:hypothetical protein
MKFDFDSRKNEINIHKHGIDFNEAISVFADPLLLVLENQDTAYDTRNLAVGLSSLNRQLLVVYAIRTGVNYEEIIRIISARKTTRAEKKRFERLRF